MIALKKREKKLKKEFSLEEASSKQNVDTTREDLRRSILELSEKLNAKVSLDFKDAKGDMQPMNVDQMKGVLTNLLSTYGNVNQSGSQRDQEAFQRSAAAQNQFLTQQQIKKGDPTVTQDMISRLQQAQRQVPKNRDEIDSDTFKNLEKPWEETTKG